MATQTTTRTQSRAADESLLGAIHENQEAVVDLAQKWVDGIGEIDEGIAGEYQVAGPGLGQRTLRIQGAGTGVDGLTGRAVELARGVSHLYRATYIEHFDRLRRPHRWNQGGAGPDTADRLSGLRPGILR